MKLKTIYLTIAGSAMMFVTPCLAQGEPASGATVTKEMTKSIDVYVVSYSGSG